MLALLTAAPAWADDAKQIASTVCIACHGEGGNSVVPNFPKLAGLQAEYLAKQLGDYISGKRKNELMGPNAASLNKDDVPALAAYFTTQKPAPGKVEDAKLAETGKKLYEDGNIETGVPACMGCHQPNAVGNDRYPRLAGQHQTYTLQQLSDFKNGLRSNDRGRIMRAVADRMSGQEMKAVAEYLAGL